MLTGLSVASFVVGTRQVALPAPGGISLTYPNPLAVRSLRPVTWLGTLGGLAVLIPLLLGSAVVSLVIRYRRGDQRLRQQMKWLALAIAGVLVCQALGALSIGAGQENKPLQQVPYAITPFLVYLGIPAAMAIAILRRRLFDIDVIISRALLVTLLSAGVTAVYAAIVLGIGTVVGHRSSPLLTVAAAVAIALVFQPLRQRATRLANRLVYGERATPYQVLSDFAADMAGQRAPLHSYASYLGVADLAVAAVRADRRMEGCDSSRTRSAASTEGPPPGWSSSSPGPAVSSPARTWPRLISTRRWLIPPGISGPSSGTAPARPRRVDAAAAPDQRRQGRIDRALGTFQRLAPGRGLSAPRPN